MFIKRNSSKRGGKTYSCVLLVGGERVEVARGPGRPRKGDKRKTKVVHRTLANLSKLPPELIALVERYCEAQRRGQALQVTGESAQPVVGRAYGPMAGLVALAREMGLERALGTSREGKLAMFLVLARVLHQGSRLSAVRWAETQAVAEVLGLERFDEEDLYETLDWLCDEQPRLERALAPGKRRGALFLYDVTSSYLEGQKNELAAAGYNRDGKRYKKQIVVGLLTDAQGEPVSGHALVSMLALKLAREVERRVQPLGLTVKDALERLDGVRLVTLADPTLGLWSLPSRWDKPQQQVLAVLPPLPPPLLSPRAAA